MRSIFFSIAVLAATSVAAQEAPDFTGAYYCKMTASAGLRHDLQVKQWKPTVFNTDNDAYTVKVSKSGEVLRNNYGAEVPLYHVNVAEFGSSQGTMDCFGQTGQPADKADHILIGDTGHFECRNLASYYIINLKTMKMMVQFRGGYMDTWRENNDTPFVSVGKCDKIG